MLDRYGSVVQRYLLGAVRDEETAQELFHELTIRFLRGDFRRVSPEKGRFRRYLKTVLINLVNDYRRSRDHQPLPFRSTSQDPAVMPESTEEGNSLETCLQEDLLERGWQALESANPTYYAVLRKRAEDVDLSVREIGEQIDEFPGGPMTAANVRKTLERARTQFSNLLLDEVLKIVESESVDEIRAELKELGLRPARLSSRSGYLSSQATLRRSTSTANLDLSKREDVEIS